MPDKATSNPAPENLYKEADRLLKEGRFADAERILLNLLEERPNAVWVLCQLGETRFQEGDRGAADGYLLRALTIDPESPDVHVGLGRIAERSGEFEIALGHFGRAQALAPERGWLNERIDKLGRKLSQSEKPAAVDARAGFWKRYKHADTLLEKRNYYDAEAIFRELLRSNPESAPVLNKLGKIAGELGHIKMALTYYEKSTAVDPNNLWGYVGQAEMLDVSGDFEDAIKALEIVVQRDASISLAQDRLKALRRKLQRKLEKDAGVQIRHWPAHSKIASGTGASRPRLAVVSWCLAHNPVGRAMILAEVAQPHADCEIVGPIFLAYDDDLWTPLRDSHRTVDIRGFLAPSFDEFLEGAIRLVMEKPCDVAWVSKPRLPSLLIGFLYKLIHGASIILDIDDDELAFVHAENPLTLDEFLSEHAPSDWREPYSKRWTQLAASMIELADAVTACNPVLQQKFGAFLLRHAREASAFDEARTKRVALRSEFGFVDTDKVVLFLGTPRRHKGVLDVAKALEEVADPHAVFCIVGTVRDRELKKELEAYRSIRIVLHPDQPFSRVAELNAMADVVCILQDPEDPIAQSQTPAKLTDAIATGTTVLAAPVPPLLDLMEGGGIIAVKDGNLVEALRAALSGEYNNPEIAEARRAFFRAELSTEVNAVRALEAITAARQRNAPLPDDVRRLFQHIDAFMPGSLPRDCIEATKGVFRSGPRVGALRTLREGVNLVFFWKQNDSSIFGRRQDMLLKQFAAMPNIKKILHIDSPISVDALHLPAGSSGAPDQGRLIAANTINRFLGTLDDARVARRTFVYRGKDSHLLGRELPGIEGFPNAVEAWLRELDMTDNLLAWVCPVVRQFPEVQKRLGFSFIAADVIDDQRQWPMQPSWRQQLETNYRETFACTDAAFANCEPVAHWLDGEGLNPLVVPNGMDIAADIAQWEIPQVLKQLPRPIVGYCGNLTQRIDWDLIEHISMARPDWSFVLIGEPAKDERCRQITARPNVHALGIIPYEMAQRHIAAFDVAMIPHTASTLSMHMNPLKLYVYRSLGIPVVSSAIANIDDLANDIRIADSAGRFVTLLEEAIAERRTRGRIYPDAQLMQAYSWESRAAKIWTHLENVFEARHAIPDKEIAA